MGWQFTVWAVPLAIVGSLSFLLFLYTLRHRRSRIAPPLLGVLLCTTLWTLGDTVRLLTTARWQKVLADNVGYVGTSFVAVSMFVLILEFVNRREWLTRRRLALLLVVPVITVFLAITDVGGLLRTSVAVESLTLPVTNETIRYLSVTYGLPFSLFVAYSYVLLGLGQVLLLGRSIDGDESRRYRRQAATLFGANLVPMFLNLPYVLGVIPLDPTSFGFGITGLLVTVAVFRFRLLDLLPVARSTVVENMDGGVLVVTPDGKIADSNPRATDILGVPDDRLRGASLGTTLSNPPVVDRDGDRPTDGDRLSLERDGETRYVDLEISPVRDGNAEAGRVVVLHDVTEDVRIRNELERRREDLERQNERLENFARIVTHDLRNPLNVARGRIELARERSDGATDGEHLERATGAVDRMAELVEDVRTMALGGQAVEDTEVLDLRAVATDAWQTVDTADATLEVHGDGTIEADRGRALQLFENLFRNAVDHGPSDVSVWVGGTDDGFFVADDGPGIPASEREQVLADGYTTTTDGTGLGLSIVRTIAEAHGWSVSVTTSEAGGARIDVRTDDRP